MSLASRDTHAFEKKASQWLNQNTPDIHTIGSSPTIMFAHIGMRNIISMLGGTAFAMTASLERQVTTIPTNTMPIFFLICLIMMSGATYKNNYTEHLRKKQ